MKIVLTYRCLVYTRLYQLTQFTLPNMDSLLLFGKGIDFVNLNSASDARKKVGASRQANGAELPDWNVGLDEPRDFMIWEQSSEFGGENQQSVNHTLAMANNSLDIWTGDSDESIAFHEEGWSYMLHRFRNANGITYPPSVELLKRYHLSWKHESNCAGYAGAAGAVYCRLQQKSSCAWA